ncbi:15621_t:CDS:2 [Funneliformis mosseae]|uniref:15621_t:CDS:1 n=1 Tax=Funneliformis mosseae TaxID=27381 RepID=A0A9N8ZBQ6_FUNMO|nr:15621_t:CDS:2 [Funneliformis mosseae]
MQASSLPNPPPPILAQIYPRLDSRIDSNFLNIPSIVTSPSIPTSVSESFLFNYQQEPLNSPISQAISAPVTPTNSVTPGFSQPPRRGKGNQNGSNSSNDGKSNSKSNSNLAHIPCKFFKSGACTAGKNCVFSHSKDPPSDNYVCKYFLKGNCKFGNKCALSHTLPNERKSSSNGRTSGSSKNVNGSRSSIPNSMIQEIRSPIMLPQGYSQDLNDFQPLNSPGIPFTRIPISPEYASSHRQFSHKSIFLPLSYVSDSGMLSPTANTHQHLHSIPELHDYPHHEEAIFEDFSAYEYEELLPSSLNDLLTPTERERRRSRQEESSEISPRRLFNSSSSVMHPVHMDSQHLNYYNSHADPTHIHFAGRSLPANYMNQNEGQQVNNGYNRQHLFGFPGMRNVSINNNYGEDWNDQLSPLSPLVSIHNQNHHRFSNNNNNSPSGYSSDHHGTPAINIPLPHEFHQTGANSPMYPGIIGRPNGNNNVNGNSGNNSNTGDRPTTPDPFSPFGTDDDVFVFFNMEEDKNDQVQTESSPSKSSEQLKTPLSYSAITKTGLKDSGATPGLSIDSRRYEPLCPFGISGNCRYGDRCHYLHGMPCPSCLKHVLHPYHSSEEHQEHINECINKQIQVADGVRPEDLKCGICLEKVLSKEDARFGLLNCEHAFCLQCIRQWRSNITMEYQVIRACPICKTSSHFITPSTTWITDRSEKQRVINEYKRKCSTIPCRNFNYGEGQCQFGISCFYAHTYRDGTKEDIHFRTIQNGEEVKVLDNVRLWDFMEDFTNKCMVSENYNNVLDVVVNDDNDKLLNRMEINNMTPNNYDNNDTDGSADTPTITSSLSVDSPVFIPFGNRTEN